MKLIFAADFEAGKQMNAAAKFAVPGINRRLRATQNVLLKTEKLLLIRTYNQQVKDNNIKPKRTYDNLNTSLHC
jgi:hypothetical protein